MNPVLVIRNKFLQIGPHDGKFHLVEGDFGKMTLCGKDIGDDWQYYEDFSISGDPCADCWFHDKHKEYHTSLNRCKQMICEEFPELLEKK